MDEKVRPQIPSEEAPFIPYVADREKGYSLELEKELHAFKKRMGFIANSYGFYLHRPEIAECLLKFNRTINAHPSSTLDRLLKRKLAVVCSTLNGCVYCTAHQCEYLTSKRSDGVEGWGLDEQIVRDLIAGKEKPANEFERVCFDFARAASRDSGSVSDEIRNRLRTHLTPAQIVELACVVGQWKFFNTVHDSLRIPVEAHNLRHAPYMDLVPE